MSEPLPSHALGDGAERAILLHGFGGSARTWDAVLERLDCIPCLVPDLPGHGTALGRTDISTVEARDAVLASMDEHGVERAHLVGHSRGGAIACLVAMKAPDRVASLLLLAPGGFGEAIAGEALATFAAARTREELERAFQTLYAPSRPSPEVVEREVVFRTDPRATATLSAIQAGMTQDGKQGTLKLDRLNEAPFPVTILWGEADAVLPAEQAHAIPNAEIHVLPGLGHMLPADVPERLADTIRTGFGSGTSGAT